MRRYDRGYEIFWREVVWSKRSGRAEVRIVNANWGKGEPIDPTIPKYVVLLNDRFIEDDFHPIRAGRELELAIIQLDSDSLGLLKEAWILKETHNRKNLKNPEQDRGLEQLREVGNPRNDVSSISPNTSVTSDKPIGLNKGGAKITGEEAKR